MKKNEFETLKLNDDLNPYLWSKNGLLKPDIKSALLQISNDFFDELKLSTELLDITLTGSLANYNWSRYSDIDLHLIVDYDDITDKLDKSGKIFSDVKEFIKDYFDSKKNLWNVKHSVVIHDFDVEIYIQDINEKHNSTGIYSILKDKWISTPTHVKFDIDKNLLFKKVDQYKRDIDSKSTINDLDKIKTKLSKARKSGLDKGGEYSVENIIFKILKREGYTDKLLDKIIDIYDTDNSLDENVSGDKKVFLVKLKNNLVFFKKSSKIFYKAVYVYIYSNNDHVIKSWSINDEKLDYFIKEAKKWNKLKVNNLNSAFSKLTFEKITGVYLVVPSLIKNIKDIDNISFSDLKFAQIK